MTNSRRKSNDKTPLALPKVPPVPGCSQSGVVPTDTELMNTLQSACGRNDKAVLDRILIDLHARHESIVLNVLSRERVPAHDRGLVAGKVWETIHKIASKAPGTRGAWDPGRGLGGNCPFVPLLKRVASSRARDYLGSDKTQRRRRRRLEEAAARFGDDWRVHGGKPVKDSDPKKRGGNLKQTKPPATLKVVARGRAMLGEALETLPGRQRRVLDLHAEGLNNEEIAKVIGKSSPTVSRDLTTARETIRGLVEAAAG